MTSSTVPLDLPLLTAEEVGELLHLPTRSVRTLALEGRLPSVRIGRRVLFSRRKVEQAVAAAMEKDGRL